MRSQLGREAPFPFPPQVAPPSTVNDARAMIREHADAGVDGLILTYPDELPNAFVTGSDVVQILLEAHRMVQTTARRFAEHEIRPYVRERANDEGFPVDVMRKLAAAGLLGAPFPEGYGGGGIHKGSVRPRLGGVRGGRARFF